MMEWNFISQTKKKDFVMVLTGIYIPCDVIIKIKSTYITAGLSLSDIFVVTDLYDDI